MAYKRQSEGGKRNIDRILQWRLGRRSLGSVLCHHKRAPHDRKSSSFDAETSSTSFAPSSIDSFEQDYPVFLDSEGQKMPLTEKTDIYSGNTALRKRMHEKLREQWSVGSTERPRSKGSLRRKKELSASCPALESGDRLEAVPSSAADLQLLGEKDSDGMLHKSMLNLSNTDSMAPVSSLTMSSSALGLGALDDAGTLSDVLHLACPLPEINVQICINDVSVDNPEDFQAVSGDEDDLNLDLIRRPKRRSSWCPEQERKKDEKEEKQRMLGINGRSQSLSSLDGQDDSDEDTDEDSDEDPRDALPNHPAVKSFVKNAVTSLANGEFEGSSDLACLSSSVGDRCHNRLSNASQFPDLGDRLALLDDACNSVVGVAAKQVHHGSEADFGLADNKSFFLFDDQSVRECMNKKVTAKDDHFTSSNGCPRLIAQHENGCSVEDSIFSANHRVERSGSHSEIIFPKEEKSRRRSSVFSKISSYRQNRKAVKGPKLNHKDHQFVSVSVSNSTSCDVCGKFLSNKPALQCENCAINVHESSCVDQTTSCARNNRLPCKEGNFLSQKEIVRIEDENAVDAVDSLLKFGLGSTQFYSHSTESLDDSSSLALTFGDLNEETEMFLMEEMVEAWSVTVDKKTLKKMTAKDIKRQDHIWELIQTEKNYFRTLKIMQKIFAYGMMKEVGLSRECVEQIFPRLEDLVEIHSIFLRTFFERQRKRGDRSIEHIGDLLVNLFQGQTGNQMRSAYGEFCSRHSEAVSAYKELRKTDRKLQAFMENCSRLPICRRLGVDECVLLVAQRLTKYPLLIEAILKTTIDAHDRELLNNSFSLIKDIIASVNRQVDTFFKRQRLVDILNRLDQKSSTVYRGTKFKKFELLVSERKLHHEGYLKWMSARGKPADVLAVVLSDIMFFLTESNQKYYFFSQDGKSSVVSLSKLLVREKDDMRDSRGFYLICSIDEPEMYELVCKSTEERSHWIALLKDAILKCSQEDLGGYRSLLEDGFTSSKSSPPKLQQLLDLLHEKDQIIGTACKEKTQMILEILEIIGKSDEKSQKLEDDEPNSLMNVVLQLETRLLVAVKQINVLAGQQMADYDRSLNSTTATQPKKRAETFSGFEHKDKEPSVERRRNASGCNGRNAQSILNDSLSSGEQSNNVKTARRASLVITSSQSDSYRNSNNNNGDKSSRRMSVNLLPNMLNKLHRDKEPVRQAVGNSHSGKSEECVASSSSAVKVPMCMSWLSTLVTDQCESLSQIALSVQSLMDCISKQSTELQSLRTELSGTCLNVSKLSKENERLLTDRRLSGFHHDKQLEELRSLQSSVAKQRKELQQLREEQEEELQKQRDQLLTKQADIDRQKAELKVQRENLRQEKDFLQRQYDLFEEQRMNVLRSSSQFVPHMPNSKADSQPSSSTVSHNQDSIRGENLKITENQDATTKFLKRGDSSQLSVNSVKEPRVIQVGQRHQSARDAGTVIKLHGVPATVQQILPMKLSTSSSFTKSSPLSHVSSSKLEKPTGVMSKNFSESSIGDGTSVQKSSSRHVPNLYVYRSQPQISSPIPAIPSRVAASFLPMKLAEKSRSTPTSANNSPDRFSFPSADFPRTSDSTEKQAQRPPQVKKESEIIYF